MLESAVEHFFYATLILILHPAKQAETWHNLKVIMQYEMYRGSPAVGLTLTLYLLEQYIFILQNFVLFCFCYCCFHRKVLGGDGWVEIGFWVIHQSINLTPKPKIYPLNQPNPSENSRWLITKHKRWFCVFSKTEAEKLPRGRDLSLGKQLTK